MHTLQLKIDDSIFEKFMGLLDILPKDKVSVSEELNSNAITFERAEQKVQKAINNISSKDGHALDDAFNELLNS